MTVSRSIHVSANGIISFFFMSEWHIYIHTHTHTYVCTPSSLVAQTVKHLLQCGRPGFDPWIGKIPWRRKWEPTPVFLSEKSHGWRSLVSYSPWGCKEPDTTERLLFLSFSFFQGALIWACCFPDLRTFISLKLLFTDLLDERPVWLCVIFLVLLIL